jgi:hypothetical protein
MTSSTELALVFAIIVVACLLIYLLFIRDNHADFSALPSVSAPHYKFRYVDPRMPETVSSNWYLDSVGENRFRLISESLCNTIIKNSPTRAGWFPAAPASSWPRISAVTTPTVGSQLGTFGSSILMEICVQAPVGKASSGLIKIVEPGYVASGNNVNSPVHVSRPVIAADGMNNVQIMFDRSFFSVNNIMKQSNVILVAQQFDSHPVAHFEVTLIGGTPG